MNEETATTSNNTETNASSVGGAPTSSTDPAQDALYQAQLSQTLKILTKKHYQEVRKPKTPEEHLHPIVVETVDMLLAAVADMVITPGEFSSVIARIQNTMTKLRGQ